MAGSVVKNPTSGDAGTVGREDPLGKEMATHSSVLAWKMPWTAHGITKSRTRLSH